MDTRTVGILGGGQLGRMLVEAANNRNISVAILDKSKSPAKQVNATGPHLDGSFSDPQAIEKFAENCDILTMEIEHVDTHVLENLEKTSVTRGKNIDIQPSWHAIRIIQDKYLQKMTLVQGHVEVAESMPLEPSIERLQAAAKTLSLPFMLKARTGAYDGRGNYPVRSADDFPASLENLANRPLYAEKWVDFKKELAVMVVKTKEKADPDSWETSTVSYPTVETVHQDSICKLVFAPARGLPWAIREKAQNLARRAVASFRGKGVFGVEMFLLNDDSLLVNEIAPRPHNSGHYTIEACRLSQYDTHLLSILDRPIPPKGLKLLKPAIMLNILGGADPKSYVTLANAADAVGTKVHLYGKGNATKGRKMGHLTLLGETMGEAEDVIKPLIAIADEIRAGLVPKDIATPIVPKPRPLVGVISGSVSDQPHLEVCYKIFKELCIPFEKGIKSAHRTPHAIAEYAEGAADRGIKAIIAAAGKLLFRPFYPNEADFHAHHRWRRSPPWHGRRPRPHRSRYCYSHQAHHR